MHILLVDDHALVRWGLKQVFARAFPEAKLVEASTAAEALSVMAASPVDLVMLDISMPGRNGLEVLQEIRSQHPRLPVLVLSMYPEDQYGVRCLQAGASGYLSKTTAPEELISATRKVLSGGKYVTAELAEHLADYVGERTTGPRHEVLSDREYEILLLIGEGNSISHIARQLNLSVKTISTYRARILRKMGLKTNAQLMHYVLANRLCA